MIRHDIDREAVLSWYTGKNLEVATQAFDLLFLSADGDCWLPKASRIVRATLGRANVAHKAGHAADHKKLDQRLWQLGQRADYSTAGQDVLTALCYGGAYIKRLEHLDFAALEKEARLPITKDALRLAQKLYHDFVPVLALIAELDRRRPAPRFTDIGASPTITKTLEAAGVEADVPTLRICPIRWEDFERTNPKTGEIEIIKLGVLAFPEGTIHGASRFSRSTGQCEVCGHRISNPYNWVPFIVDGMDTLPRSLWVGRDCAKTLFGVKVEGEMHIKE